MAYNFNQRGKSLKSKILFLLLCISASLLFVVSGVQAQSPTPTPESNNGGMTVFGGYEVTSSIELGVRGVSVNGNDNKYRSDFNYKPGFRLFDSSFLIENKDNKSRAIDSLLVTSSGWNGDPSGFTRISVERAGFYRFDSSVRQVKYFNNLNNHSRNAHNADFHQNFGDFDLTLYPNSDKFRLRFGGGFNKSDGTGTFTTRAYSDEFIIPSKVDSGTTDLRAGIDSNLLGFNLSLSLGYRRFRDFTNYTFNVTNPGFNTTNNGRIDTYDRQYPIKGSTEYALFNVHRTFAKKLDFTGRFIYSITDRKFEFTENITGRDNSNNIVDSDRFFITGNSKRPQTRVDLGVTYAVTSNFRISDSFTYDTFHIDGGTAFTEALLTRTSAGGTRAPVFTNTNYYDVTGFRRYSNTIEGDYQVNDRFGFHLGYRYTKRRIELFGFIQTLPPATTPTRTIDGPESEDNQTNTFIGGFKVKPLKNWTMFADVEHGDADNAFTRLANYKFTNLRLRSRWSFKQISFNVSAITKDNENPSTSTAPPANYPAGDFIANTKNRIFSAFVDWNPISRFSFSGGYTFNRLVSETDIVINTGTLVRGRSQFYMRDHYAFFNFTAQPIKRITFYASYNHDRDYGQGNRLAALPLLISSYPFKLRIAESRLAWRITRNVEWNLGYQYIGYNEAIQPLSVGGPQDYHANLPYTSLRFYFGGGEK